MNKTRLAKERRQLALIAIALTLPSVAAVVIFLVSRLGIVAQGSIQLALELIGLVLAFYISVFTGYLSWRALVFAAVPRIEIEYLGEGSTGRINFGPKEEVTLKFEMKNLGWWYAKPASTNTEFFLAFGPEFSLKRARYGSQLELEEKIIRPGKKKSQYFWVKGIHLYYNEPPEEIVVDLITPTEPGEYECWVSSYSEQTTYGVFHYVIRVVSKENS